MDSRPKGLAFFRPLITLLNCQISSDILLFRTMIINPESPPANTQFIFNRALNDNLRHGYLFRALGLGNQTFSRNGEILADGKKGVISLAKVGDWNHFTYQFIPPHCQFYFNGKLIMGYTDKQWIDGLDEIALWGVPGVSFDNLRIYTAENNSKP
jgi:hypothetical protein